MVKVDSRPGDSNVFTAPTGGVVSGVPVLIGALLVIPQDTKAQTLLFVGIATGVFGSMAAQTPEVWAEGERLQWNDTAKEFTTATTAGFFPAGVAAEAKTSGGLTGVVRLDGVGLLAI